MQLAELQRQAEKIIDLPDSYQLIIREPYTRDEGGALFVWEHKSELGRIAINVDAGGKLTRISVDRETAKADAPVFEPDQLQRIAEDFVVTHYPDALDVFEFHWSEMNNRGIRFYFVQFAGGLPLDRSGFFVDVSFAGEVLIFMYSGAKKLPAWPSAIISKEKLMEDAQQRVELELKMVFLSNDIYDVEESGPYLVYDLKPHYLWYKADHMTPELLFEEEEPPVIVETHSAGHKATVTPELSPETLIGIDETMLLIRESESESETVKVWRPRNEKNESADWASTGLIQNRMKNTVKASISKKTGELTSVIWFLDRIGNQRLDTPACYQIAVDFLLAVIPNHLDRLHCQIEEDEDDNANLKTFNFKIQHRQFLVMNETVSVTVNRTNGKIEFYTGPSFALELLDAVSDIPTVEIENAREIYWSLLDFRLAWTEWDDSEELLIFENVNITNGRTIHFIDAQNGAAIGEKRHVNR